MMENLTRLFKRGGIKVSELIAELQKCDPDAEVWMSNVNELGIPGYCVLDHVMTMNFGRVESDIMDNPGEIDNRLLQNKTDDSPIVFLGSMAEYLKAGIGNPMKND